MALRYAVANGNWSNTATWNGGTLPTSADDVYSNNFRVVIDQNVTVLTLRNVAGAPAVAGGGFTVNTAGLTITMTANITTQIAVGGNSSPWLFAIDYSTGGNTTINCNFTISANSQIGGILICATNYAIGPTITWNGNIRGYNQASNSLSASTFNISQPNTIFNIVGNIDGILQGYYYGMVLTGTNMTVNITGNVTGEYTSGSLNTYLLYCVATNMTVNIIGNVVCNTNAVGVFGFSPITIGVGILNITGNIIGGVIFNGAYAISSSTVTTINHVGICKGGNATVNGSGCPAVALTHKDSSYFINGILMYGDYGCTPAFVARMFLANNTSKYVEFASNSTNGALLPAAPPTRSTMYSPNTIADAPATNNVREGIVYALGSQTGTLKVPNPANVALGIQTDNTVGTAALTPANVWDYLLTSIATAGSIGKLLKDNIDARVGSRLSADNYTEPDNTSILAIKAKTDNLPTTPANEETSQTILTALGNIEIDVPTPLEISTQVWLDEPERLKNVSTVETTGNQIAALT